MAPMEYVDVWLHAHRLTWLGRALGVCWLMNRRLDAMERSG